MKYKNIIYEKEGRIAKITLNRPEVLNAMNSMLNEELGQALDSVEKDEEVDVLILAGAGRAFCAGVDLKEPLSPIQTRVGAVGAHDKIRNLAIPTICAVQGYAVTGGLELAMACDIIIAAENAMFADTHTRVSRLPAAGMSQVLPRLIGPNKAKELSFTGNYLSAQEALQFGLVNRVVPLKELQSAVEKLAQDILTCNQKAVRRMKYLINETMKTSLDVGRSIEALEYLRWRMSQQLSPEEAERARKQALQRGRAQKSKK